MKKIRRSKLMTNFDLCTGCNICTLACSEKNDGGYNPRFARLKITQEEEGLVSRPIVCNQCINAYCINICPVGAVSREGEGLNIPVIDEDLCTGCGLCAEYCPEGVVVLRNRKAQKCDLCKGRPVCVDNCPTGALLFSQGDEVNG